MDAVFVVDIILNFFTAYVVTLECHLIVDRRRAANWARGVSEGGRTEWVGAVRKGGMEWGGMG